MIFKIFLYLLVCALVGWASRNRTVGFLGGFLLAVFFTPLVVALVLLLFNINYSFFKRKVMKSEQ